jgi:hypothetical protein
VTTQQALTCRLHDRTYHYTNPEAFRACSLTRSQASVGLFILIRFPLFDECVTWKAFISTCASFTAWHQSGGNMNQYSQSNR